MSCVHAEMSWDAWPLHKRHELGGDQSYHTLVGHLATYYLRVRDVYGSAAGDYTLTVAEGPRGDR